MKNLKVYVKFTEDANKKKIAFVTKKSDGSWAGCLESDIRKKRIVVADAMLAPKISPKVLYKATLIPMNNKSGFVAISAEPVQFDAHIEVMTNGNRYKIAVCFGNKRIVYNPYSSSKKKNSISEVTMLLYGRNDIKDKDRVISDFNSAARKAAELAGSNKDVKQWA